MSHISGKLFPAIEICLGLTYCSNDIGRDEFFSTLVSPGRIVVGWEVVVLIDSSCGFTQTFKDLSPCVLRSSWPEGSAAS